MSNFFDYYTLVHVAFVGWGLLIVFIVLYFIRGIVLRNILKDNNILESKNKRLNCLISRKRVKLRNSLRSFYPYDTETVKLTEEDIILDFDTWKSKVRYNYKKEP